MDLQRRLSAISKPPAETRISLGVLAVAIGLLALQFLCPMATAQMGEWTWVGGSDLFQTCNNQGCVLPNGVYGTLGVSAATNVPGGRIYPATWTDKDGNLWLFGGQGFDSVGGDANLNDLWKFNLSTQEWTWIGGNNRLPTEVNGGESWPGVYGELGVPAAGNFPGARQQPITWTDQQGDLWMFGGESYGTFSTSIGIVTGNLWFNDLWRFDPPTNEWTWMSGSNKAGTSEAGVPGIYGTLGVPAMGSVPGSRLNAVSWIDDSGNLWLFGGQGMDSTGYVGDLNDLWEFKPATGLWAWMGGSDTIQPGYGGRPGVYGTLGVPAATNIPGGRQDAVAWTDLNGNFWLFGGQGYDSSNTNSQGFLNDLWEFNKFTREWTWMGGSSTLPCSNCGSYGVYGTLDTPSAGNVPGGRSRANHWTDNSGNFWLFGGLGFSGSGQETILADLWKFDPSTNVWTWMGGWSSLGPCAFGSIGCGWLGLYGTLGIPDIGNNPGSKEMSASWADSGGNLWLFGGYGNDSIDNSETSTLNDLWVYRPGTASPQQAATPLFSLAAGAYTGSQAVTISDATPHAAIYYTIDGTTPTTTSSFFFGHVEVGAPETIRAMAVAPNYFNSEVASAAYVVTIPPPTFTLTASPASITIASAQSGIVNLTVNPQNGFNSPVTFACSGLPSGTSCAFNPATVAPFLGVGTTTLTITAGTLSGTLQRIPGTWMPESFALLSFCIVVLRRRGVRYLLMPAMAIAMLTLVSGCGSGKRAPVMSTVTVTATAGSIEKTATVSLTVD